MIIALRFDSFWISVVFTVPLAYSKTIFIFYFFNEGSTD